MHIILVSCTYDGRQLKIRALRAVLATIENDSTSFPGVGRLSQDCNMYRCKEDINVDSYRNKKR